MCRNIRTLFNFEPPATEEEIRASALQFVRKLSGFTHPSRANEAAFARAVNEVSDAARRLLDSLETASPTKNREVEALKAREGAVCLSVVIPERLKLASSVSFTWIALSLTLLAMTSLTKNSAGRRRSRA